MSKQLHLLTEDTTPDSDAYLVLDKSTYSEAVKVSYTKLFQTLPVALQTSGGNARGTGAVDLQVTRTLDTQVASGNYSVLPGGAHNTASGAYSVACGYGAKADKYGQFAHASGYFAAAGDAQRSVYVMRNTTANATPTLLYLDGSSVRLTIADDTVWNFRAEISGMTADAAKYAAYRIVGLIKRANGTVAVSGIAVTVLNESTAAWDATAEADNTNKALSIKVTGEAATTIRWVATVYTTEVTYAS